MQPVLFPEWVKEGMHVGLINTTRVGAGSEREMRLCGRLP